MQLRIQSFIFKSDRRALLRCDAQHFLHNPKIVRLSETVPTTWSQAKVTPFSVKDKEDVAEQTAVRKVLEPDHHNHIRTCWRIIEHG